MSVTQSPDYFGSVDSVIAQSGLTPDMLEGVNTDAEVQTFIEDRLRGASQELEQFCNRQFRDPVEFEETREGNGTDTMQLRHHPVTSIVSLESKGNTLTEGDDYKLKERRNFAAAGGADQNKGVLKRLGRRTRWYRNVEYTITYEAGWTQPPGVIESVAEDMVIAGIREAIGSNAYASEGASSISMDGFSVTYDVPGALRAGDITESQFKRVESLRQLAVA